MPASQEELARRFRDLHHSGSPLLLANAWDVATARLSEAAGFPAVATTSAGTAALYGHPDGEGLTLAEVSSLVRGIVDAVSVPVSVDAESGYEDAGETASELWSRGAVGLNLEDGRLALGAAVDNVRAVRRAVPGIVLNARTDEFWLGSGSVDEAIRRGNAFLEAGADCVFVPLVRDVSVAERLVAGIEGPVNLLAGPGSPTIAEMTRLGVSRISVGSTLARACLGLFRRACDELREQGSFGFAEGAVSYAELQELLRR